MLEAILNYLNPNIRAYGTYALQFIPYSKHNAFPLQRPTG
jgi:hypothetical protein